MRLVLHPQVASDIGQVIAYYTDTASAKLADEFYSELRHAMLRVSRHPTSVGLRANGLRRVNLKRFPYHFLFRTTADSVRILVVRHHRKNPAFGLERL